MIDINIPIDINDIMEQLSKQVLIRISQKDYELLMIQAKEQNRSIAWVARENLKKGIETS